jgi:hypothetical protein
MTENKLAIVIPAYKSRFLRETLRSIVAQTDQRCSVYVGDDGSPESIASVVQEFSGQRPITYRRFENNLGGTSIVEHYNRCIALAPEPWIWLFSDDDTMEPTCVADFYQALAETDSRSDVYRFSVTVIDEKGAIVSLNPPAPPRESPLEFTYFFLRRLRSATAQETVLSRAAFERKGGLPVFPLGWGSDVATIIGFSGGKDITGIPGSKVRFRKSGANISSMKSRHRRREKLAGAISLAQWLVDYLRAATPGPFPIPADSMVRMVEGWFRDHLRAFRCPFTLGECMATARFLSRTWGRPFPLNLVWMLKIDLDALYGGRRNRLAKLRCIRAGRPRRS